jgi:hypothetical protein
MKLDENKLNRIIKSEIRKVVSKRNMNEAQVKTANEMTDGDYAKMCGILIGKIEALYMFKDYCETVEDFQKLIARTFDDIIK